LPDNYNILQKIDLFSVNKILHPIKEDISPILRNFKSNPIVGKIINEYHNINFVKWINISNTTLFWAEVNAYRDAGGNNPFGNLAKFVLELLSLPWSNADVEQTFSHLNLVKSKIRNRMQISTLNAILNIRYGLSRHNKCCHNYEIPNSYIRLIGTNVAYVNCDIDMINTEDSQEDWIDIN
ncbi:PREDICTED: uncharacterized protein LOC105556611, partial [Vollenhovia emeryi]|uniref:uncharacterized protein LOC105556611 n=1 Tax=Vollenhovia emeryi TaxID=411798 RepID=UPI0005F3B391